MNALAVCQAALVQHDTIILLPGFTVASYIEAASRYRATVLTSVPTMIAMMLRERDLLARSDLSSVAAVRMGSAPVSPALLQATRQVFPQAAVNNAYGTTEAGPIVFAPHPDGRKTPDLSLGVALPRVELRLADGNDREAKEGVLQMRCPALMNGYHNLPEATRTALTEDGFLALAAPSPPAPHSAISCVVLPSSSPLFHHWHKRAGSTTSFLLRCPPKGRRSRY